MSPQSWRSKRAGRWSWSRSESGRRKRPSGWTGRGRRRRRPRQRWLSRPPTKWRPRNNWWVFIFDSLTHLLRPLFIVICLQLSISHLSMHHNTLCRATSETRSILFSQTSCFITQSAKLFLLPKCQKTWQGYIYLFLLIFDFVDVFF